MKHKNIYTDKIDLLNVSSQIINLLNLNQLKLNLNQLLRIIIVKVEKMS